MYKYTYRHMICMYVYICVYVCMYVCRVMLSSWQLNSMGQFYQLALSPLFFDHSGNLQPVFSQESLYLEVKEKVFLQMFYGFPLHFTQIITDPCVVVKKHKESLCLYIFGGKRPHFPAGVPSKPLHYVLFRSIS